MYIEDLISTLAVSRSSPINRYDLTLIDSFYDQISKGYGFTEKQENLSIKILKRQTLTLNSILHQDVSNFLNNPKFRLSRRIVSSTKRMSLTPDPVYGKVIKVEFPFDELLLKKIREEKSKLIYAAWNPDQKAWLFSFDERSLTFLNNIAAEDNFIVDDEFANYQTQINDINNNIEQYVPMITLVNNHLKFLNVSPIITQPDNLNIIENLFYARKLGISTWDSSIEDTLEWQNAGAITKRLLQTDPMDEFIINLEETKLLSLAEIVCHSSPTLFVIPGGSELEKTQLSITFLKSMGINTDEISILFRLPKDTGEEFNNFVRNEHLNSPLTTNTKAVFISSKVPKTILASKMKFNSVINFNFYNIHYSIRNLLRWHYNIIHVTEKKKEKKFNYGIV